jgi:hypothetical protein
MQYYTLKIYNMFQPFGHRQVIILDLCAHVPTFVSVYVLVYLVLVIYILEQCPCACSSCYFKIWKYKNIKYRL